MSARTEEAAAMVRAAIAEAAEDLVEREAFVELVALAAVAGEHLLVVGPPGTAKSEGVRRMARAIGGRTFEYLLGRFTEPSEIFGPIDLRQLREGRVEVETTGMLPEAELAFLDEVFLGSTAILNTLLGILNERVFVRGHTRVRVPLRVCVGASNHIPEEPSLAAFADRFLLHVFLEPLPDPRLEELLASGWSLAGRAGAPEAGGSRLAAVDALHDAVPRMDLDGVRPALAEAIRALRSAGVELSDRRAVKVQRLVAAAALVAGRSVPGPEDLWPLVYAVPTRAGQDLARDTLRDLLALSHNAALPHAAEDASRGPEARAERLCRAADRLFDEGPGAARRAWLRKLEGVAREIDAGFLPEQMPARLAAARSRVVAALQGEDAGAEA